MNAQAIMADFRSRSRATATTEDPARDSAAIAALTRRMTDGWNRGDGDAYGALFTDDCDYIAFDGTHLVGRAANARHHQALFDTVLRGSRLVFEGEPTVRFLSADIAIMHAMGSVLLPWQDAVTPKRRSNQTYVVVRRPDGWRIAAFHNTRHRPMTLPAGFTLKAILFFMLLRSALGNEPKKGQEK